LKKETQPLEGNTNESMITKVNEEGMEVKVPTYASINGVERRRWHTMDYSHPFWTRATSEIQVKLGGLGDSILAFVDHGSEINIISRKVYNKSR
jgi:hypothetical protein